MEKSSAENIRLGLFVLLGTACLIVAIYLIGSRQNLFGKTFELKTVFQNINGLQEGNNVRFSGITIGTVRNIEMKNDSTIYVHMAVEENMLTHIRKDAIATIGSDGLVGSMLINIVPGDGLSHLVENGDEIPSFSRIGTDELLNTLNVTNENAAILTAQLLEITDVILSGKGTVGQLLVDTLLAKDIKITIGQIKNASIEGNRAIKELRKVTQSLGTSDNVAGVLLSDSISAEKIKGIFTVLESTSVQLEMVSQDLGSVMSDISNGKGALNYFVSDTVLVEKLKSTMDNVESGSIKLNEDLEALKHNFLFRRYFKKIEKQKKKDK
ncbi:MAG: phospholipid/cholesterol/gamma-HCH transport system substrate-binding protein [Parvicellaceae bacterium]|jgi:phospholipid/cholesterol/gamma-HCH transport system substrate-binding protein